MRDNIKLKMKIDAVAGDSRGDPATRAVARRASAKLAPPPRLPIFVEVQKPRPPLSFGKIEQAEYTVTRVSTDDTDDGATVQLFSVSTLDTDGKTVVPGKSLGHKFRRIVRAPLSPRQVAAMLLRQKVDFKSESFNRTLHYPRMGRV